MTWDAAACWQSLPSQAGRCASSPKSAAVRNDFDLIERCRDRVLVGLSLTAAPDSAAALEALEPHASTLAERIAALREAHDRGLRTYGMLCPLLPGLADSPAQVEQLVRIVVACGAEEVFAEPVNARGPGLRRTQEVLARRGFGREADAVGRVRRAPAWSAYVAELLASVQHSVRAHCDIRWLRFLLYSSRITPHHMAGIRADDAGVVWLGQHGHRARSDDHGC
jgi:DNA repair photolyase